LKLHAAEDRHRLPDPESGLVIWLKAVSPGVAHPMVRRMRPGKHYVVIDKESTLRANALSGCVTLPYCVGIGGRPINSHAAP
jgi:hypothetical protein